jgi:hypothetical protein
MRINVIEVMRIILTIFLMMFSAPILAALDDPNWRQTTDKELRALIPARAAVEKERIETEFRTASGVTNGRGKFIAGVVIITAGYSAEGKYSHFLITQVPVRIGEFTLPRGEYVFGYQRVDNESLEVKFYEAANGKLLGSVRAHKDNKRGAIRSFLISPPVNNTFTMQIGRFMFECKLSG